MQKKENYNKILENYINLYITDEFERLKASNCEDLLPICKIYGTLFGILDYKRDLEIFNFDSNNNAKEELEKIRNIRDNLLNDCDYLIGENRYLIPAINGAMKETPSYKSFAELSNNMGNNHNQVNLEAEFMLSYLFGYNSKCFNIEEILDKYNSSYADYNKLNKDNHKVKKYCLENK